jgi:hypothetical protein
MGLGETYLVRISSRSAIYSVVFVKTKLNTDSLEGSGMKWYEFRNTDTAGRAEISAIFGADVRG